MLVLTRRPNQSIWIDRNIRITVRRVAGDRVLLGIEAPKKTRVMREELLESSSEEQARWLLGRMTEHEIVQQCANVKGRQWLEEQGGHPR